MPRIPVREKATGKTYEIEWNKDRSPTPDEIRSLLSQQSTDIPDSNPSFNERQSTAPDVAPPSSGLDLSSLWKRDQGSILDRLQTSADTLWGGAKSVLPAIPGVTRPVLPEWNTPTDQDQDVVLGNIENIGKGIYNNVVVPGSSLLGAATDFVTNEGISKGLGAVRNFLRPAQAAESASAGIPRSVLKSGPPEVASPSIRKSIPDIPEVVFNNKSRTLPLASVDEPIRPSIPTAGDVGDITGREAAQPTQRKTILDGAKQRFIDKAKASGVPEVEQAAEQVERLSPWKQTQEDWTKAISTQIQEKGDAGKEIARLLDRSRVSGEAASGSRTQRYYDAIKGLDDGKFDTLVDLLDNGVPEDSTIFKTAKGSIYETSGKGTSRYKAVTGEKFDASHSTVYLDPDTTSRAQAYVNTFGEGNTTARLQPLEDGKIGIVVKDRATGKVNDKLSKIIQGKTTPEKGLHPLEVWNKNSVGERKWHFGNEITELSTNNKTILPPDLAKAYDAIKPIGDELAKEATASKMGYITSEGRQVPFQGRENYFPHLLPNDKKSTGDIIASIMKRSNLTRDEAEKIVSNSRQFGERAISAQHGREVDFEGFRRDRDAYAQHIHDMSMRISRAKELGPMDIAGGHLADLIEQTDNPSIVRRNLKRVLGREEVSAGDSAKAKFANMANQAEVISHLSNFAIGNFSQNAMTALNSNTTDMMGALAKRLIDKREFYRAAQRTGVLESTMQDLYRETGGAKNLTNKVYGIKASEEFNRALAANTGKNKAQRLMSTLQKNPNATAARTQLEGLLQTKVTPEMLEKGLSETHLNEAAGRFTERVQGRAQSQDLPFEWTGAPHMSSVLLFKKYAYQQARIMARTIAENPAKAAILGPILLQATGELGGDAKEVLKGAGRSIVSGKNDIPDAIEKRGEWTSKITGSKNKILNRVVENYLQSWALGLPGDLLKSVAGGDSQQAMEFITGPVISDAANLAVNSLRAVRGNAKPLAKDAVSRIPFVGSGLASSKLFKKKKRIPD